MGEDTAPTQWPHFSAVCGRSETVETLCLQLQLQRPVVTTSLLTPRTPASSKQAGVLVVRALWRAPVTPGVAPLAPGYAAPKAAEALLRRPVTTFPLTPRTPASSKQAGVRVVRALWPAPVTLAAAKLAPDNAALKAVTPSADEMTITNTLSLCRDSCSYGQLYRSGVVFLLEGVLLFCKVCLAASGVRQGNGLPAFSFWCTI